MTLARRPRRAAALLPGLLLLAPALSLLGCGASSADLHVDLKQTNPGQPVRPGEDVSYTVVVGNHGPGAATGVTVRIDLPTAFRYQSTSSVDVEGTATRTQPSDPPVDTADPQWGQWSMGAPGVNADGTSARATLAITFSVRAEGKPADYPITPHVFQDGGDEVVGKDLSVHLNPASDLNLALAVDEGTVKRGDLVHYHVTLLNRGSGAAKTVGLLLTLPGGIVFDQTQHLEGNFSRSDPIDPITGALVVYYGGFTLPPAGASAPGTLAIVFTAKVLPTAVAGRYTVSAQVTDADGAVITLDNTAPVTVNAPAPTPTPSPGAAVRATATPRATPRPSPTPTPKH